MEIKLNTGFGRPRRLGLIRHTTIYLYSKYEDAYAKAVELARTMGISFSELVSIALTEYVKKYYPTTEVSAEAGGLNRIQYLKLKLKEFEVQQKILKIERALKLRDKHEKGTLYWFQNQEQALKLLKKTIKDVGSLLNPPKPLLRKLLDLQAKILVQNSS